MADIIVVEKALLRAQVFRQLNGTAKTIFFDFLMKRRAKKARGRPGRKTELVILNNGEIEYCYSEAEKRGIPRARFMRGLDDLVRFGFIDIAHRGSGGKRGDRSLYFISDRWRQYGTADFIEAARQQDKRSGRGFSVVWEKRRRSNIGIEIDNPTVIEIDNRKGADVPFEYQE